VVGSEIPNVLEPGVAATLVVSEHVDVGIPVDIHTAVKMRLRSIHDLRPSPDEPSVWLPLDPQLLEVNFVGIDRRISDASETYVFDDDELPLLVFGHLSLLTPGDPIDIGGLLVPVPKTSGLLIEKLLTDRTGDKGDRDLLVALGLVLLASDEDLDELAAGYRSLEPDLRHAVRSNVTILSLLPGRVGMPDVEGNRERIAGLLRRLEAEA
jgi:hypothetical protein